MLATGISRENSAVRSNHRTRLPGLASRTRRSRPAARDSGSGSQVLPPYWQDMVRIEICSGSFTVRSRERMEIISPSAMFLSPQ